MRASPEGVCRLSRLRHSKTLAASNLISGCYDREEVMMLRTLEYLASVVKPGNDRSMIKRLVGRCIVMKKLVITGWERQTCSFWTSVHDSHHQG